jgi:glycosyltransferase involved in cell wall biosynthesis
MKKFLNLFRHSPEIADARPLIIKSPVARIESYASRKGSSKRALLSYLVQPVIDELNDGVTEKFSNDGIARAWPKALNELGYEVDIINWDDTNFIIEKPYDLVISHGAINFKHLAKQLKGTEKYIYFSTGSYWQYHNEQEDKRLVEFRSRNNFSLPRDRYINNPEEDANSGATGIICLGNQTTADTYKKFKKVINLPIGCYPETRSINKDLEAGRKNFLFFSGAGNIHKGLDLLIEAFAKQPDYSLHISTFMDDKFAKFYAKELKLPNIIVHNFVTLRSEKFYEICDACNYIIFPSCSEGSPGSVVECMQQGLIPIVSKTSHIDIEDTGIVLDDVSVTSLTEAIKLISGESLASLKKRSVAARRIVKENHSPAHFANSLTIALGEILDV